MPGSKHYLFPTITVGVTSVLSSCFASAFLSGLMSVLVSVLVSWPRFVVGLIALTALARAPVGCEAFAWSAESCARGLRGGKGISSGPSQARRPTVSWQGAYRCSFTAGLPVCEPVHASAGQLVIVLT